MRCWECGAEFDEWNESQPVCAGCGSPPGVGHDDAEIGALLESGATVDGGLIAEAGAAAPEPVARKSSMP